MEIETVKKIKTGYLEITLKSDLCAGSGYTYAGIIDQDICYDAYGIPYIPAKRIKGVLREAAELIRIPEAERTELFGEGGLNDVRGIYLSNAYIEGSDDIVKELSAFQAALKKDGKMIDHPFHTQNILEQFTTVKAQTKIGEDGTADDTSLRFTRTVNHYAPWTDNDQPQELKLIAKVTYYDDAIAENLRKTAKALRNMGLNRNRGLGSISCIFREETADACSETISTQEKQTAVITGTINDQNAEYILDYTIENTTPLMLSAGNDSVSEKYISGQSVLGYFAGAYLKGGNSGDTEAFRDLFLKNKVTFSNLYPVYKDLICYPAPAYINKLKKSGDLVNVSDLTEQLKEKASKGDQPKKLRGKFVGADQAGNIHVQEVETEIIFHHAKTVVKSLEKNKKNPQQGQLYSQEAVRAGQQFRGQIRGKGTVIEWVKDVLEHGALRFGKSKSAQYGSCCLVNGCITEAKATKTIRCKTDERILVVLRSDSIFMDETCGYTVRLGQVREKIKESLLLKERSEKEAEKARYSEIEVKELTGYYTKWNLKRQAIPVVEAGSAFEYILDEDQEIAVTAFAGERTGEGYGQLEVLRSSAIQEIKSMDVRSKDDKLTSTEKQEKLVQDALGQLTNQHLLEMCRNILEAEIQETLKEDALKKGRELAGKSELNPAALGRVTLMLTESKNAYPEDADQAYSDFRNRIETIKNDKTKERVNRIVNQHISVANELKGKDGKKQDIKFTKLEYREMLEKPQQQISLCSCYKALAGKEAYEKMLKDCWSDYMMQILVGIKYGLK